jgi:hypothetical protein
MSNFTNSNGLVNGCIPKGQPCPFLDKCECKNDRCPTVENPNLTFNFSCAVARAFSITIEYDKKGN